MNDQLDTSNNDGAAQNQDDLDGGTVVDNVTQPDGGIDTTWNYAEGVTGQGDAPEWFKGDKYQTVADQAKAYPELESRLGSFTGAPEDGYSVNLTDDMKAAGVEISSDDPMMVAGMNYAKETHMSQEGFDGMVDLYLQTRMAEESNIEEIRGQQMQLLGDRGQERIDSLITWGDKNLSPEQLEGFKEMATSAATIETMEAMVSMTREGALNIDDGNPATPTTIEEVQKMQFEKDDNGNRRLQTDPEFRKRYETLKKQAYGTEPHRRIIGPR